MTRHPYHRLTSPRRVGAIRRLQELVERISDDTTYNVAESSVLSWLSTATGYTLTAVADIATYMKPSEARVQYAALITAAMVGAISPLGNYAANDVVPATVLDFENDVYAGTVSAFSDLSFAATSNGTVIDSDGVLKWRAHNFVLSSNIFNGAGWINQGTVTDTDGEWSELTFSGGGTNRQLTGILPVVGAKYTAAVELRAGTLTAASVSILFSGSGLGFTTTNATLTSEGQLVSATQVVPAGTPDQLRVRINVSEAGTIWVRYARVHRSDLGGMANNPDTGNSYVPTTTAAVYKERYDYATGARRLLIEPTATTNHITYSSDFSNWIEAGTGTLTADGGNVLGVSCYSATASSVGYYIRTPVTLAASTTYTFWSIVKGTSPRFQLRVYDNNAASFTVTENFDLSGIPAGGTGRHVYQLGADTWLVGYTFTTAATVTAHTVYLYPDAVNGTATVEILHAQVEAASVPHSAIPTAGATATRAAETLALPAAKIADYQTPTYIGDELVTNGTFDTDLTGWGDGTGGTGSAAWSAGTIVLTNSGAGYFRYADAITTEIGKVYEVTFDFDHQGANGKVFVSNLSNGTASFALTGTLTTDKTAETLVFVATATTTYVYVQLDTGATASSAFDNISVREINPLAVSFAMSGEVTYADNDTANEVTLVHWGADGSNYIFERISTSGADVGSFESWQGSSLSGNDISAQLAPGAYSPGVNVPFAIAARHTSTGVQGAADGVASSANADVVDLMDGSATDIKLAYSGGPMRIAKFIVWNEDIGETGIEEASA